MEIHATQAEMAYASARPTLAPSRAPLENGDVIGRAAEEFAATLQRGEDTAMAAMSGKADPQALVMALTQAELAVETAATLRDKVVEAYQEILRMPV